MSIAIPLIGWLILPITGLLVLFRRDWLFAWAAFTCFFQASSALNIQWHGYSLGLQPGLLAASVSCLAWLLFRPNTRSMPPSRQMHWIMAAFGAFMAYAVVSSYVIPTQLSGELMVYPPRLGLDIGSAVPLRFGGTNASQDFYLLLVGSFFVVVAYAVYTAGDEAVWQNLIRGWLLGGAFSAAVGIYQVAAAAMGLPFPTAWFYSNAGYANSEGIQYFDGSNLARLSGTLAEPSVASFFLGGVGACALWLALYHRRSRLAWITAALTCTALVITKSTTGYVALGVIAAGGAAGLLLRVHMSARTMARAALLLVAVAAGVLVLAQHSSRVAEVWRAEVARKSLGLSYLHRQESNVNAWNATLKSGGAGVGWGSTRCSSLALNVLANAGVPGTAAVLVCLTIILGLAVRARRRLPDSTRVELEAVGFGLITMALAGVAAVPDIMQIPLWMAIGMLAGLGVRTAAVAKYKGAAAPHLSTTAEFAPSLANGAEGAR